MKLRYSILLIFLLFITSTGYCQTATEFCDRGLNKYFKQDYIGAIADYKKAIKIDPKNEDAFYNRALAVNGEGFFLFINL